jgi:hypothetical protein
MSRPLLVIVGVAVVWLALTACVTETRPADCDAASATRQLRLANDRLTPQNTAACLGQQVRLIVTSEEQGVLHLHGYESAAGVDVGDTVELAFTADRSGQFPFELHVAGEQEGIPVGILTVHER